VQLLRTYPDLRHGRDYPFARGGERSVARGYTKALLRATDLVYLEDQYVWGNEIGEVFTETLRRHQDLHVVAVVPLFTDQSGFMARVPQKLGRARAMQDMLDAAPGRVAVYGIENHESTPVYVHAKVCVIDDTWASIGSDNFNRRSWTHDSELSCVVVDPSAADHSPYARRLRLTLAAEHLDRDVSDGSMLEAMGDCLDGPGLFAAYAETAAKLDAWHDGGRVGERPPGRLRRLEVPELTRLERLAALVPYLALHDPDGRPSPLKKSDGY
jgi:phosphatidylserine/phosphatidylglycerophosphate/cardiolipin synthase-like enzyme